ncbi:UbiA family prenyltransferase [Marinigracilibium pacificum]|uniref:UbiA family prenyltransferase n=1 Tax=Marinigracilibium pacificum TaxID=2729599 RepID=A0A848IV15_9BACT|nr:UbiA family prenyltransferase [Marinigracilibium pacificum]NMM47028.1 UbiA family prenyltransferase [Marinigracilibium pacificum]
MDKRIKSTLLHLRFPFSLFLSPIYLFGLSVTDSINVQKSVLGFIIWHLLIYPASNGFNSYYDKDEGSIGGLKSPPKVNNTLLVAANLLDISALSLAYIFIGIWFTAFCFLYILVSRAYSYPLIRLKKYPWTSWAIVGFFQGAWVLMSVIVINSPSTENLLSTNHIFAAIIASMMLYGSYPITQIYQHEEDSSRGDNTISLKLGIKGTFLFSMALLSISGLILIVFLFLNKGLSYAFWAIICTIPIQLNLTIWYMKYIRQGKKEVTFKQTMKQNAIASILLNICFIGLLIIN